MRDGRSVEDRLGGLRQPISPGRQAADLTAMASIRPAPGRLAAKVRVAAAFVAGLVLGGSGLAAANALPDPAQHVAHQALDRVGIQVPDPARYHGPECGDGVMKNHGGYVKVDKALAKSDCGKPVGAGGDDTSEGEAGKAAKAPKGPCQGKPPWAGNKAMTPEESAVARAERAAQCGADDGALDDEADAGAAEAPAVEETTTTSTTVVETTTTTTEATADTAEDATTTTG